MEPISENRISFTECLSNLIFGIILPTWDVFSDIYFGYSLMKNACRFRQKNSLDGAIFPYWDSQILMHKNKERIMYSSLLSYLNEYLLRLSKKGKGWGQ